MCLGTVCRVVSTPSDGHVVVRRDGYEVAVSLLTLAQPVAAGDWLLVHCGLALAHLTEDEALDALRLRDSEVSP
jgi:hydrogenase assembly chaperone HypC/HupF